VNRKTGQWTKTEMLTNKKILYSLLILYSYLNDSMGSLSEALFAGEYPKITPTAAETPKAINTEKNETIVIIPAICWISFAIITPRKMPTNPPDTLISTALGKGN
jgi:hypothetical protein